VGEEREEIAPADFALAGLREQAGFAYANAQK
jgi:hypothetical protein